MFSTLFSNPLIFVLTALALVIAVTVHEFCHAWVADHLGDPTPRVQGRLTLNPLAHLDPIGTITMLLIGFGWGKPVEFDPYNLKNRTRDAALIAFAGPLSNIVMAILAAVILHLFPASPVLNAVLYVFILINVSLAVFNFIPVAPLDGEKILYAFLPKLTAIEYRMFMRKNGLIVLLVLMAPIFNGRSPISQLMTPITNFIVGLLLGGL